MHDISYLHTEIPSCMVSLGDLLKCSLSLILLLLTAINPLSFSHLVTIKNHAVSQKGPLTTIQYSSPTLLPPGKSPGIDILNHLFPGF